MSTKDKNRAKKQAHKTCQLQSKKSFRKGKSGKKLKKLRSRCKVNRGADEPGAADEPEDHALPPPKRKTGKQADDCGSSAPKPKNKPGRPRKAQPEHLFTGPTEPAAKRKPKAAAAPKAKRAKVTEAAEAAERTVESDQPTAKSAPKAKAKAKAKAVAKARAQENPNPTGRPFGTRAASEAEDEKYIQYYAASFVEYGGLDAIKAESKEWLPVYGDIGFDIYWTRYSCGAYFKKNGQRKKASLATFSFGSTVPALMVAISCAFCLVPESEQVH